MPRVVMLGPPGAGKGTQGTRLAAFWSVPHISSGTILRRALAEDEHSEIGQAARTILQGNMVSDEVASRIILPELDGPGRNGFVLDGFPRNVPQAEILRAYLNDRGLRLDGVIALRIGEDALVARLMGRLTCPNCGESYHAVVAPPKVPGICDRCGAALEVREDDQPTAIRRRLALYHERTAPLFDYYAHAGRLRPVDAEGDEDAVFARCLASIEEG